MAFTTSDLDPRSSRALRRGSPLVALLSLSLALAAPVPHAAAQAPSAPAPPTPAPATPASAPATPPASAASDTTPPDPNVPLGESLRGMARADYAAARILYDDGDYSGALTKLESAYEASKDPRLLWNMAACEKALRHYARVIDMLEQYLVEGKSFIGDEERAATRELVGTVQEFVNELRLDVQPAGADVFIDGVKIATAPLTRPLRLDMGRRQLRVEKAGFVTQESDLELSGGKSAELKVVLVAEVHQGTLRIVADPSAVISVDGHVVGTATWSGQLPSGAHTVHVTADGKQTYQTEVAVKDNDTASLHVNLQDQPRNVLLRQESSSNAVWWVVGGVALAAGAGVGAYFLMRPDSDPTRPDYGTLGGTDLQ